MGGRSVCVGAGCVCVGAGSVFGRGLCVWERGVCGAGYVCDSGVCVGGVCVWEQGVCVLCVCVCGRGGDLCWRNLLRAQREAVPMSGITISICAPVEHRVCVCVCVCVCARRVCTLAVQAKRMRKRRAGELLACYWSTTDQLLLLVNYWSTTDQAAENQVEYSTNPAVT